MKRDSDLVRLILVSLEEAPAGEGFVGSHPFVILFGSAFFCRALVHQPHPRPRANRSMATRLQRVSTEEGSGRTAAGNLCRAIVGSLGDRNSVISNHGL
jgi:hypothetical protein